jgi:hypothetical protein
MEARRAKEAGMAEGRERRGKTCEYADAVLEKSFSVAGLRDERERWDWRTQKLRRQAEGGERDRGDEFESIARKRECGFGWAVLQPVSRF